MNKKLLALGIFIVVFQLIALLLWYIFDWNLFGPMLIGALVGYFFPILFRKKKP
jgi:4-hydroxybenzoate polyprenyltransferase